MPKCSLLRTLALFFVGLSILYS